MNRPSLAALAAVALCAACASPSTPPLPADAITPATAAAKAQALAQPPGLNDQDFNTWLSAQRQRLATEKQAARQRHDTAETACWQRFAVNDCLQRARQRLRTENDALRQQELALNAHERQRHSASRLQKLEQNGPNSP